MPEQFNTILKLQKQQQEITDNIHSIGVDLLLESLYSLYLYSSKNSGVFVILSRPFNYTVEIEHKNNGVSHKITLSQGGIEQKKLEEVMQFKNLGNENFAKFLDTIVFLVKHYIHAFVATSAFNSQAIFNSNGFNMRGELYEPLKKITLDRELAKIPKTDNQRNIKV